MQPLQLKDTHQSELLAAQTTPLNPVEPPQQKLTLELAGRKISIELSELNVPHAPHTPHTPHTPMGSPISASLDLTTPILDADNLQKQIANIKNLPQIQELKLSGYKFNGTTFTELVDTIEKHPKIKRLVLTKSLISELQIAQLQLLCSGKKTLKVIDSEGNKFGPAYMDWHEYNVATSQNHEKVGMRESTSHALECLQADYHTLPESVFNLGSGPGQDAITLAQAGCQKVLAIDADEEAIAILKNNLTTELSSRVTCILSLFKDVDVSNESADLFVASFTWPYQKPSEFAACWKKTVDIVKVGGYIAGHFFGPISNKKPDVGMTFHTESELRELLSKNFEIKWFKKEPEGSDFKVYGGSGSPWGDLFHVVAKKVKAVVEEKKEAPTEALAVHT